MKMNARKLLFSFSRPRQRELLPVTMEQCQYLLPTLSSSGLRSLLFLLKKQGLMTAEALGGITYWRVTDLGVQALTQDLPVLSFSEGTWDGTWACLVFKEAPSQDKQFRYLRELLIKRGALSLTRGVFLHPDHFSEEILRECQDRYRTSVTIFNVKEWVHGDDRSLIIERYALLDLAQAYSGISTEVERLINRKRVYSELTHQEKKHLFSLFDRLYLIAVDDRGLLPYYYPQVPRAFDLLKLLQTPLYQR